MISDYANLLFIEIIKIDSSALLSTIWQRNHLISPLDVSICRPVLIVIIETHVSNLMNVVSLHLKSNSSLLGNSGILAPPIIYCIRGSINFFFPNFHFLIQKLYSFSTSFILASIILIHQWRDSKTIS